MHRFNRSTAGFSLVELSLVLVVVGLLASRLIAPMKAQFESALIEREQHSLGLIKKHVMGYLADKGYLPCPVSLGRSSTVLTNSRDSACHTQRGGVPAVSLGLKGQVGELGELLDSWGNPYRYAVTAADHQDLGQIGQADWLTPGDLNAIGPAGLSGDLQVCREASISTCAHSLLMSSNIVWVVVSQGARTYAQSEEQENLDNDAAFVSRPYSSHPQQGFDDHIIWASKSELVYWLLKTSWFSP